MNKVETIQVLGHTVKWWCTGVGSPIATLPGKLISYIKESVDDGDNKGRIWLSDKGVHVEWEIVNQWKEIAENLYKGIKQHTYADTGTKDLIKAVEVYEKAIEDGK